MFHQRGEPGLFAVQEASDECLLEEVHKVDRLEQAAQLLCRLEGSFKIHFHFPVQEVFLFLEAPLLCPYQKCPNYPAYF